VKKIALKEKVEESRGSPLMCSGPCTAGLRPKSWSSQSWCEEGAFRCVDRREYAVDPGGGFLRSNPGDEKRLRTAEYRQRIAESLYRGIAKYVSGLSGVKVASRIDKAQGQ